MRNITWKSCFMVGLLLAGPAGAQDTPAIIYIPGVEGGYPEGIAWNSAASAFMVSSLRGGHVGLVSPTGEYAKFSDDRALITTSGIVVDAVRNRVLVCNEDVGISHKSSDRTRARVAQVVELDLKTGVVRQVYDFSSLTKGPILANDLTIDDVGNIYVTDSFQPQIYKVDHASKAVSVLVRSERLMPAEPAEAIGTKPYLNGIVYHPDGFLLASDYSRGLLWKVPLSDPQGLSQVRLPEPLKAA